MFHVAKVASVTCANVIQILEMICSSDEEENENDWEFLLGFDPGTHPIKTKGG